MSNKTRMAVVIAGMTAVSSLLVWFAFHPRISVVFFENPLIIAMLLILGIAPVYPLFKTLQKRPPISAVAIVLLILGVLFAILYFVGSLVFHTGASWVSIVSVLSDALIIASCCLLVLNAVLRGNRQQ
jgi:hypothetical protein